jgi:hypothetical protein
MEVVLTGRVPSTARFSVQNGIRGGVEGVVGWKQAFCLVGIEIWGLHRMNCSIGEALRASVDVTVSAKKVY